MKSAARNRPTHIVKGNIFNALGFSASEASALKIKAEILSALLEHVRAKGYTQAQLVDILASRRLYPSTFVSNSFASRGASPSSESSMKTVALCRPAAFADEHRSTARKEPSKPFSPRENRGRHGTGARKAAGPHKNWQRRFSSRRLCRRSSISPEGNMKRREFVAEAALLRLFQTRCSCVNITN